MNGVTVKEQSLDEVIMNLAADYQNIVPSLLGQWELLVSIHQSIIPLAVRDSY